MFTLPKELIAVTKTTLTPIITRNTKREINKTNRITRPSSIFDPIAILDGETGL